MMNLTIATSREDRLADRHALPPSIMARNAAAADPPEVHVSRTRSCAHYELHRRVDRGPDSRSITPRSSTSVSIGQIVPIRRRRNTIFSISRRQHNDASDTQGLVDRHLQWPEKIPAERKRSFTKRLSDAGSSMMEAMKTKVGAMWSRKDSKCEYLMSGAIPHGMEACDSDGVSQSSGGRSFDDDNEGFAPLERVRANDPDSHFEWCSRTSSFSSGESLEFRSCKSNV